MLTSLAKIDALVAGITRDDIRAMPPAHRQHLAQVLRFIADLADPPPKSEQPKAGFIKELRDGRGRE